MKKLLMGAAMLMVSGGALQAADLAVKAQPSATAVQTAYRWDGAYVGGYVGAQQGKSNTGVDGWTDTQTNPVDFCRYKWVEDTKTLVCEPSTRKPAFVTSSTTYPAAASNGNVVGVTFGAYGGYNKQLSGGIVAGIELDGGWSGARDYTTIYAVSAGHKMPWNFNLTGRLGVLVTRDQNTLVYVKGGLAVLSQHSEITGPSGAATADHTKAGWTVGGGIEQNLTVLGAKARVEGVFTKVSDQTVSIPGAVSTLKGESWRGTVGLAWPIN